nr:hypothetical protein CFP56_22020 [Quercus suber]
MLGILGVELTSYGARPHIIERVARFAVMSGSAPRAESNNPLGLLLTAFDLERAAVIVFVAIRIFHVIFRSNKMQPIGSGVHTDRSNSMPWVPGEAESTSVFQCVVPSGEDECIQCKRSATECIIKDDDERRRPISRAYVNSLTHRIALLESLLENHSIAIPPSTYPPQTAKGPANLDNADANTQPSERPRSHGPAAIPAGKNKISSPSVVSDPAVGPVEDPRPYSENTSRASLEIHRTGLGDAEAHEFVERLLSTRGHLSWDQLSGKLRYFGFVLVVLLVLFNLTFTDQLLIRIFIESLTKRMSRARAKRTSK